MKTLFQAKSKANMLEDNLIPMINIIFLLLIFFMIAGQISRINNQQNIAVPQSNSKKAVTQKATVITVTHDNTYFIDDKPVSAAALEAKLSHLDKQAVVNLLLDKQLAIGDVDVVLALLKKQQVQTVTLLTEQAKAAS